MIEEFWKKIDGFNYEVSTLGRVRSIDHVSAQTRRGKICNVILKGKIRRTSLDRNGYERVCLYKGNRQIGFLVHRLVAEAFLREIEDGEEVNHKNYIRAQNDFGNLEIIPIDDNRKYSTDAGRRAKKLNELQVRQIKYAHLWGEAKQSLAVQFGVSRPSINAIVSGECWKRVDLSEWQAAHD